MNKAIQKIRNYFGISKLEDWTHIEPSWITDLEGIGGKTLDRLRGILAFRGVTLKGDRTVEHWKQKLGDRQGHAITEDDTTVILPFSVVIDTREQQPFGFEGIRPFSRDIPSDLKEMIKDEEIEAKDVRFHVPKVFKSLGEGKGDYSIEGFEKEIAIERKSMFDAHSTMLSNGHRKQLFENELEYLQTLHYSAVVIECDLSTLLGNAPSHGKKTKSENRKQLLSVYLAWANDFRVPWHFCMNRSMAEVVTLRIMQRFMKKKKQAAKSAAKNEETEQQIIDSL